jgi:hypothetical protein
MTTAAALMTAAAVTAPGVGGTLMTTTAALTTAARAGEAYPSLPISMDQIIDLSQRICVKKALDDEALRTRN